MSMLDLKTLAATPLIKRPFSHFVATNLLSRETLSAIQNDFPDIHGAGIFPLSELTYGPAFAALIGEISGSELEELLSEKFGIDLSDRPQMITVRGHCRKKDGRIHTDTDWKVLTVLLYLNDEWEESGGRIRFVRGPDDINAVIAEVSPDGGTMVAFRPSHNSYHGHKSFVGRRRYVMFNWVTNEAAARRELARHRMSAKMKRYVPFT